MKKSDLKKYANLLVECGVNLQKGQELNVYAQVDQVPLVKEVVIAAYKHGASRVNVEWNCQELTKVNYLYRSVKSLCQVENWEIEKIKHMVDVLPARLYIASEDPDMMKGLSQARASKVQKKMSESRMKTFPIFKPFMEQLENKQQWCVAGAASPEWAKKVFPDLPKNKAVQKLWDAILYASRVWDDPVAEWKKHNLDMANRCKYLNDLHLKELRYKASNGTDFKVGLIEDCKFEGGSEIALGSNIEFDPNIPTEEVFTSPKKGLAEGLVVASKPLSYQGQLIEDFSIRFENGKAVEVHAKKGEEVLKQMIAMDEGAAYLGECALIPYDSPINNTGILFYETLYDENAACHLALGMGFTNLIKDFHKYTKEELNNKGINDSMIHVDFMIGTSDMSIVGITSDNKEVQIFNKGNWAF